MNVSQFLPSRRWCWRIFVSLLTLTVTTVAGRWVWWERTSARGEEELAAAIAETDALDPRWRWEQIEEDRPKIPDEQNSILVVRRFEASRNKWDPSGLKMPDGERLLPDLIDNRRLSDDRIALLLKELTDHKESVEVAVSLKDFPRGRAKLEIKPAVFDTLLRDTQACRMPAQVLSLDIERLLHDHDVDGAWLRVRAILHAGAGLRDEGTSISQLVRIALRTIAARRVERILAIAHSGSNELEAMQRHLASEENEDLLVPALRGDRAMVTVFFENLKSGLITIYDGPDRRNDSPSWYEILAWKLYRARLPADQAFHLRTMQELIAIAQSPYHEQMQLLEEFHDRFRREAAKAKEDKERIITTNFLPAVDKVAEAAIRDKAILRCTITALAVERYRLEKKEWPKKLDDLCPKYMKSVLIDPFDGKPLKYTNRDDGVTIYSAGVNGVDDGGVNLTGSGKEPVTDLGFRLWNPDQRGLPAVAKNAVKGPPIMAPKK